MNGQCSSRCSPVQAERDGVGRARVSYRDDDASSFSMVFQSTNLLAQAFLQVRVSSAALGARCRGRAERGIEKREHLRARRQGAERERHTHTHKKMTADFPSSFLSLIACISAASRRAQRCACLGTGREG